MSTQSGSRLDQDYSKEDVVLSKTQPGSSLSCGSRCAEELKRLNGNFKYRQQTRDFLAAIEGATNQGIEHFLSLSEPNATTEFVGQQTVPMKKMGETIFTIILPSMPNFNCCPIENTYREDGNTSSIVVVPTGTHTGQPFALPNFPPIPTTQRQVTLVPSTFILTWSDQGKIAFAQCGSSDGSLVGPPGFYVKLGGKLPETKQFLPVLQTMFKLHNTHVVPKQPILDLFTPTARFLFKGAPTPLQPTAFVDVIQLLHDIMPDFNVKLLEETYKEQFLTATVEVQATGTHTGKPFVFPPGGCVTPLEPSGKKIAVSRERLIVQFDPSGKFQKLTVETVDGTPGGPVGAYLSLGGQIDLGARNALRVIEAYQAFSVGNIPKIINMTAPNPDWVWGEDLPYNIKTLPWYGRQIDSSAIMNAFSELDRTTKVLKFSPRTISPISSNTIIAMIDIVSQSKKTNKVRAGSLVHHFELNGEGKIQRFREYCDTAALIEMYQ